MSWCRTFERTESGLRLSCVACGTRLTEQGGSTPSPTGEQLGRTRCSGLHLELRGSCVREASAYVQDVYFAVRQLPTILSRVQAQRRDRSPARKGSNLLGCCPVAQSKSLMPLSYMPNLCPGHNLCTAKHQAKGKRELTSMHSTCARARTTR
jgi:hypothetical protein